MASTWTRGSWTRATAALDEGGLNIAGVASGEDRQDVLPGCRSVLVLASGGTGLWEQMVADIRQDPAALVDHAHPLDACVARLLRRVDPIPDPSRRWVLCSATETINVDFRPLALAAGLGHRSRLGLLLHPTHGPWMGLRAACFTTDLLPTTGPLPGAGPCEPCPAPCVSACPGAAMTRPADPADPEDPGGWDVGACSRFHSTSTLCAHTCHARVACPEGAAHRYGPLQLHYHYNRVTGRPMLAEALGVKVDPHSGVGPFWGLWEDGSPK